MCASPAQSVRCSPSCPVPLSRFDTWCELIGVDCSAFSISSSCWQHVSGWIRSGLGPCLPGGRNQAAGSCHLFFPLLWLVNMY